METYIIHIYSYTICVRLNIRQIEIISKGNIKYPTSGLDVMAGYV